MVKHRVEVCLDDKEEKFLKWLAEYDNSEDSNNKWTLTKEISVLARLKIQETMKFYESEGLYNDNL